MIMKTTALSILFSLFFIPIAYSHSWYDYDCCGKRDCKPVPYDEVYEGKNGDWHYGHYVFRSNLLMVRPSKDKNFHVCIVNNSPRCIYVVQGF